MPPRRRDRRVGPWVLLAIFLSVAVLATAITVIALRPEPRMTVNGHRVSITTKSFSVADAVQAAGVDLRPGAVYSAATHTLLGHDGPTPDLLLDGRRVGSDAMVHAGDRLQTVPVDTIESVVTRQTSVVTLEGLPDIEHTLFHPGHGPVVERKVGERSGEVTSESTTSPAAPAEPVKDKLVALTFDDGPDPTWTPKVLEILRSEGVIATFCLVGHMVKRSKTLANEIVADGHLLCNHTANHALLGKASSAQVANELNGGADTLEAVTGVEAAFYRPPGGEVSPTVVAVAHERGQRVLHWSLDSVDYRRPAAATMVERVVRNVGPGAVVLMHDGGGDRSQTVAALRPIIQALKAQGYGFTTPAAVAPVSTAS